MHHHHLFLIGIWAFVLSTLVQLYFLTDESSCLQLTERGYWAGADNESLSVWQPNGCTTAVYQAEDIQECFGNKRILMFGDSTVRQVFEAISDKLHVSINRSAKHDTHQSMKSLKVVANFAWDVYLEEPEIYELFERKRKGIETNIGILLVGSGLHFAAWRNDSVSNFTNAMTKLFQQDTQYSIPVTETEMKVYVMPLSLSDYKHLRKNVIHNVTPIKVDAMNNWIRTTLQNNIIPSFKKTYLWSFNEMNRNKWAVFDETAIHVKVPIAHQKADIVLNHYCNPILEKKGKLPKNASCCISSGSTSQGQRFTIGLLLCLVVLITISLCRRWTWQKDIKISSSNQKIKLALIYFCSALLFCFWSDRTHAMGKLIKQHNEIQLFYLLCAVLSLSFIHSGVMFLFKGDTRSKEEEPSIISTLLNSGQTEEWKGWMQAVILLYHWTGTSKSLYIYKIIRVLVAAYLFLSGYGTTMSFFKTRDGFVKKLFRQLLRLNLLSIALSYTMGHPYLDYYFAPLVSMWLIITYTCLGIFKSKNRHLWFVVCKVFICSSVTSFIIFKKGIIETFFNFLEQTCHMTLNAKEWRFRVGLDPYIVYFGILVAIVMIKLGKMEQESASNIDEKGVHKRDRFQSIAFNIKVQEPLMTTFAIISTAFLLLIIWISIAWNQSDKATYNALHPFISPLPIFAFALLRNSHSILRSRHSTMFARLGRCSLETYTLQYHLFLGNNTSAILSLPYFISIPRVGFIRIAELFIIMLVFLYISEKVSSATSVLVSLLTMDAKLKSLPQQYTAVAQEENQSNQVNNHDLISYHPTTTMNHDNGISYWIQRRCNNYWVKVIAAFSMLLLFNRIGY